MAVLFDHIVVSARARLEGGAHVTRLTGAEMGMGGEHKGLGTHNLLCQLGGDVFLEVISRNPDEPKPDRPLWYGLDNPPDAPALSAWVLGSDDLDRTLARAAELGHDLGRPLSVQRGALSWRFALRADGGAAVDGSAPYVMQWDQPDPHPSMQMADPGLRLQTFNIETPRADDLSRLLDALLISDDRVVVTQGNALRFSATLKMPDGASKTLT